MNQIEIRLVVTALANTKASFFPVPEERTCVLPTVILVHQESEKPAATKTPIKSNRGTLLVRKFRHHGNGPTTIARAMLFLAESVLQERPDTMKHVGLFSFPVVLEELLHLGLVLIYEHKLLALSFPSEQRLFAGFLLLPELECDIAAGTISALNIRFGWTSVPAACEYKLASIQRTRLAEERRHEILLQEGQQIRRFGIDKADSTSHYHPNHCRTRSKKDGGPRLNTSQTTTSVAIPC
ncbi:MAG TPA: hypothetical protein VKE98_17855 [Gemmataceae bacterium]|nr:hypothetical protein [Gemmataceae bacterium]